jgi:DNA polymerase-3 subunit gamma/tau
LLNEIAHDRVSHAYLFCGTRGTGKTSTAKVFAKALNCRAPVNGEPCETCETCGAINAQRAMCVTEIDAASNNGVDNVREIREEVRYPPTDGRYKVYIIDEVHMLSAGAFNALLKTLEEPPEHVVFILATTDPQKIPATILSRCQRFDFKRISVEEMTSAIKGYVSDESLRVTDEALEYIARVSDGAMRDALSILDQCSAFYYGEEVTLDKALNILGAVDSKVLFELTGALYSHDSAKCLEIIDRIVMDGRDVGQFAADLLSHMRGLLVAHFVHGEGLNLSSENIAALKAQAAEIERDTLIHYINIFSIMQGQLRYAPNERILLEVACVKICNPSAEDGQEALMSRIKKLENAISQGLPQLQAAPAPAGDFPAAQAEPDIPAASVSVQPDSEVSAAVKAVPEDIQHVAERWGEFAGGFEALLKPMLEKAAPKYLTGGALTIVCASKSNADYLKNKEHLISKALEEMFRRTFELKFLDRNEYDEQHAKIYGTPDTDDGLDALAAEYGSFPGFEIM